MGKLELDARLLEWRSPMGAPRKPEQTEMEYQMRNWYYFLWLCGDHINEQHIHNLDVANWVKGGPPVKAEGMGGRQVPYGQDNGRNLRSSLCRIHLCRRHDAVQPVPAYDRLLEQRVGARSRDQGLRGYQRRHDQRPRRRQWRYEAQPGGQGQIPTPIRSSTTTCSTRSAITRTTTRPSTAHTAR